MKNTRVMNTTTAAEETRYTELLHEAMNRGWTDEITTPDGQHLEGYIFGTDEMFGRVDGIDYFYQLFFCGGKLYWLSYLPSEAELVDLELIDYETPLAVEIATEFAVVEG